MAAHKLTPDERIAGFWSRVEKRGPDECWLWTGAGRNSGAGYGRYQFNGKLDNAHRIAWILTHGQIASSLFVLHRCDNPPCCNPAHLFLGRQADNLRDCHIKGRRNYPRGERHGLAKLTAADAVSIRSSSESSRALARHFEVTQATINNVLSGRTWKHMS